MANVNVTRLPRIHTLLGMRLLELLENGAPMFNKAGDPILLDGKPLYRPPTAAELSVARQFLADNNIQEEDGEGSGVGEVKKQLRAYDDSPLMIPERDSE